MAAEPTAPPAPVLEPVDVGAWHEAWLSASLDLVTVVELVTIVMGAELTGVLVVQGSPGTRRLFFEQGRYQGGQSDQREDRLGEVLWRKGRISLDQLMIAGESITKEKRLGRVLIELGFLDQNELRPALRDQAREVFEAACLVEQGRASFLPGVKSPNPVTFVEEGEGMIDAALDLVERRDALKVKLGDLSRPFRVVEPAPSGRLEETEEALLQLAASAKAELAGEVLLEKANLRTYDGLRAMGRLVEGGWLAPVEALAELPPTRTVDERPRLDRQVEAIGVVMKKLDESGFGLGDAVREYCAEPPEEAASALAGVDLDALEPDALARHGELFTEGGVPALEDALSLLLDFALFEARDCMPEEEVAELLGAIAHLDVLL